MKLINTSAQKTVTVPPQAALEKLLRKIEEEEHITFASTKDPRIFTAAYTDNSILTVATFDKGNGKTVAMVDHKHVDAANRQQWHSHWRDVIDNLFK